MLVVSVPLTIAALLGESTVLQKWLNVSLESAPSATVLYRCILIANVLLLIGQTLVAVLDSLGKIHVTNSYQFVYNCIYWIGTIIVAKIGYKLDGVGVIALVAAIVWVIILSVACYRYWGRISTSGLAGNFKPTLQKQLSHGLKIFSGGLLSMMIEPLSKILTGNLIGVKEVGYLEIAYKLRTQVWGMVIKALYPIFPIISAGESALSTSGLVSKVQKNLILLIIPAMVGIYYTFPFLLRMWLGADTPNSLIETVSVIMIAYLVSAIAIPAYFVQLAFRPASIIYAHAMCALVNIVASITLYKHFGYSAIVWANSAGILVALVINIFIVNVKTIQRVPSALAMLKYTGCTLIMLFLGSQFNQLNPPDNLGNFILFIPELLISGLVLYFMLGFLQIQVIQEIVRKFRNRRSWVG